jgi:LmbE family N-acetylglucosaminyl deacetylase
MSKRLVVVAHPDDEVLWFISVLLRHNCDVICVTNGRDDRDRVHREPAFRKSMSLLGVESCWNLNYPDESARLDVLQLAADLKPFSNRRYDLVFTHSPFGETFEHSHHQDVCYAVHQTFENVRSVAWNAFPEIVNALTPSEYALKKYLLGTVYHNEYRSLKRTYPVLSVETFVEYSREAVDIFYWSIANGGNNHERLAKYDDFWGFQSSEYERERHQAILDFVAPTCPRTILEYGSCEGVLTRNLSLIAETHCVETAPTYVAKLAARGFKVVQSPRSEDYDTAVVASFVEYLDSPRQFLSSLRSQHLVVQVGLGSELDNDMLTLLPHYELSSQSVVHPRWENLVWGGKSENLPIYRVGARVYLFRRSS